MFTGIIQDKGRLLREKETKNLKTLWIESLHLDPSHFNKGASIACNGVCLTVESYDPDSRVFQVSLVPETIKKTTFHSTNTDQMINLEPALRMGDALGGHFVTGHVDGMAKITDWTNQLALELPEEMMPFVAPQGSLTIQGISLTIQSIQDKNLFFSIIPETKNQTNITHYKVGDFVNFEVDYFARSLYPYIKSYLKK